MPEEVLDERTGAAKRRVTRKQLAAKAGLSVATVDRVVNARRPVRRATALRVQAAAEALGYRAALPLNLGSAQESLRCAVLLQKRTSLFYQALTEELKQAGEDYSGHRRLELTVEFMDEYYLEPSKVAKQVRSLGEQADALAVVAIDSPYISEAIDALATRHIPVVALLSDLSAPNLAGYVGMNNRIAGRTAAWAIARCARQAGPVGVLIGSHGYLGQEDREIGFRSYFREKRSEFKVLEPVVCRDDAEVAYKETIALLEGSEDLVGLYSVGGGNRGAIRALEENFLSKKPAYVCHELTPPVRSGLIGGTVDFVVAHDLPQFVRLSLQTIVEVKAAPQFKKRDNLIPFLIFTSENA